LGEEVLTRNRPAWAAWRTRAAATRRQVLEWYPRRIAELEAEINGYGYASLQQGQVDNAIRMFRVNVELFPDSRNVYDSLGEALLGAGRPDEAAAMSERSLALNPDNTNGREILDRIRTAPATAERTRES
jgi:tetratricopeptide (TPR) repeat protein